MKKRTLALLGTFFAWRFVSVVLMLSTVAFAGSVTVSSPASGSTVASPVRFVASATSSAPITGMKIYVDGLVKYATSLSRIDVNLTLANGSHQVVVRAWDNTGAYFSSNRTITVGTTSTSTSPSTPPTSTTIPAASTGPLSIKTTALPSCTAKAPCAMVLVGGGGSRDDLYEWSIASGSLPPGMKLDSSLGAIYTKDSTIMTAGSYTFTVKIQDAAGATAVRTFTVGVNANSTTGVAVSAPRKLAANTTYVVQNDLQCAETCFAFTGDNATLDCNGHKLVYNTSGAANNYGVAAVADYDALLPIDRDWAGRGNNLTIRNCRIEESDNAAPKSHGIRVGQGGTNGITVQNTEIITKKTSSEPFYASFTQKHTLKQNILYNRGPAPYNRSMLEGVSIRRYGSESSLQNLVEDNVLINSPQGGIIFTNSPNTIIRRNAIKLSATATNAFAVYAWNQGVQIYDNTIDNYADDLLDGVRTAGGRGIQISGGSLTGLPILIYNNMIRVREVNRNAEYGGCVIGGAYGIQFEKAARNSRVYDNTIIGVAKECDATALRVTSETILSATNYENTVYNNVLVGQRIGTTSKSAVGVHDAYGQWLSMVNNRWIVDSGVMGGKYEASTGRFFFSGNTFLKGSNPASKWGMWADVGACGPKLDTHSFVDNNYANGAGEISTYPAWNHSCAGTGDYKKFRYRIGWSYELTLTSSKGGSLAGATVTVKNNTGAITFTGTSDSSGKVLASVYTRYVQNTYSSPRVDTNLTNTVTISKTGCTTQSYAYNPTGPTKQARTITCQ
jgi:hypothetical protein